MVFNATFNNISVVYSFIGGGDQSTQRKPPTCRKSLTTDKHCHIEYTSPEPDSNLLVISTHCIGSCKSNYHAITMVLQRLSTNHRLWLMIQYTFIIYAIYRYFEEKNDQIFNVLASCGLSYTILKTYFQYLYSLQYNCLFMSYVDRENC